MSPPPPAPLDSKPEERRFLLKLVGFLLTTLLLFVAVLRWRDGKIESRFPRVKLPDGTWLVAQAVTVGTKHSIEIPYPMEMQFKRWKRGYTETTSTGKDRMLIYLTRESDKGQALDLKWFARAELAVSNDFTIPASNFHTQHQERNGSSGSGWGPSSSSDAKPLKGKPTKVETAVARCEFPLVRPRHGKLRMNVYDGSKSIVAVLEIPYPKLSTEPTDDWQINSLPSTKSVGNLDVTLKGIEFRRHASNYGALSVIPKLEFRHDGQPSQTWAANSELFDALGNQAHAYHSDLSPLEPVWKLRLTLSQTMNGRFLPEEIGTLPPLPLTSPRQLQLHSGGQTINGTEIQLIGLGGPGPVESSLPNCGINFKTKNYEPGQQSSGWSKSCRGNFCDYEFFSGLPFLITTSKGSADGAPANVQVIVRDQEGAELPTRGTSSTQSATFWFFDPKPTSTSVTFQFIVQKQHQVEFFLAPPQPDEVKIEE